MTILTYLDLSTLHLLDSTIEELQQNRAVHDFASVTVAPYPCGVFVTVPPADINLDTCKLADLRTVLGYAQRIGVHLVRFDADGQVMADLPEYE